MPELADYYAFRDRLAERVRLELLGPVGGEQEALTDPPTTAYHTGILHPRRNGPTQRFERVLENDDTPVDARLGADEHPDIGVSLANTADPSSMGMTFAVDTTIAAEITLTIQAAVYRPTNKAGSPVEGRRAELRSLNLLDTVWRRKQLELKPISIDTTTPGSFQTALAPGLEIRIRVRRAVRGTAAITTTLTNVYEIAAGALQAEYCFFQTYLEVSDPDGGAPFVERPRARGSADEEFLVSKMLYRHAPAFATGHGCSVMWDWDPPAHRLHVENPSRAAVPAIRTEFAPRTEVLLTESNPDIDVSQLQMTSLGVRAKYEVTAALRTLVEGYERWIDERNADARRLSHTEFGNVAREQMRLCRATLARMRAGIDVLEKDPEVFEAFQLASRAMAIQRSRTAWIKSGRIGEPVDDGTWRPFQIGFFLLCLEGITDRNHPDRNLADVLWFPTGGGKTEAYLGLIAFTIFLRRLRLHDRGAGVTVIMRYTLRLLTLQQFERAAALLCAMELFRRQDARLGKEPISIGMWVGRAATPNDLENAAASIRTLREGNDIHEQNPVQLQVCPWCGTAMDAFDYTVDPALTNMTITCPSATCSFRSGLPVHIVDEALYAARPSLVIATADKFAQIAWREDAANLFNRAGAVPGTPPPALIVQDELHLISGPLGTLAGLYESAIDLAADRPKIIASTATIRHAQQQGSALFDRKIIQFPPAGLDARDSWFAVEAPADRKASRTYLGLMAPATSQATLLVETYAALLHHAQHIDGYPEARDPYWTLIGYFSSLRLLAAAELQVQDLVYSTLGLLAARDAAERRRPDAVSELTSRVKSSDIPRRLKSLERALGDNPFDIVLATNMISVGVDVDRLGLMAVMGQPQMTAEYIQATSRIGRRRPGLAVVMYNAMRSRDRSHYEDFLPYHTALYRQVESTSVTPFSSRARDRALHAAFVGAARLLIPQARANDTAGAVEDYLGDLNELRDLIVARVKNIDPAQADAAAEEIDYFVADWRRLASANPDLVYEAKARSQWQPQPRAEDTALLRSHSDDDLHSAWPTLWSLRDVDVEADLYLES